MGMLARSPVTIAAAFALAITLAGCFPWDSGEPAPTPSPATEPSPAPTASVAASPVPTASAQASAVVATSTPAAMATPRPTAIIVTPPASRPLPTVPAGLLSQGNAQVGRELFINKGCIACHQVRGEGGTTGPALDGIGSRARRPTLAGSLDNTPENLWRWITNPQLVKPGTPMSPQPLSPQEAADLVAYLRTLQ